MSMMANNAGIQVLPFYLLCDESGSMSGTPIQAVNEGLQKIWKELIKSPATSDKAWVSVISFSDTAEVLVPLTDLQKLTSMPGCQTKGQTSFGNAFRKMKQVIDSDVMNLKAQQLKVIRPVVFFMSDGEPTDSGWQQAHAELTDPSYAFRPHIMSFGIGSADGQTIHDVATDVGRDGLPRQAYLAADGFAPEKVINEIMGLFISTILGSTKKPDGGVNVPMPQPSALLPMGLKPAIPQVSLGLI